MMLMLRAVYLSQYRYERVVRPAEQYSAYELLASASNTALELSFLLLLQALHEAQPLLMQLASYNMNVSTLLVQRANYTMDITTVLPECAEQLSDDSFVRLVEQRWPRDHLLYRVLL
jgi:hypothetical protein